MYQPKPFNYLDQGEYWKIKNKLYSCNEAISMGYVPFFGGCNNHNYWMLRNCELDCIRLKVDYLFVLEESSRGKIAIYNKPKKK